MSSASQLQEKIDVVKAGIQQAKQDLYAAEKARDENAQAFQRGQLEHLQRHLIQLYDMQLILLRGGCTAGQCGFVLLGDHFL